MRVPTTTGDPVYVGVLVLVARPGDTVRLESLVPAKVEGDAVIEPIVDVLDGETRLFGAIAESDVGDSADATAYEPLGGVEFADAAGPVALAVRIRGTTPVHGFDGLTLRYRLNDGGATMRSFESKPGIVPLRGSF